MDKQQDQKTFKSHASNAVKLVGGAAAAQAQAITGAAAVQAKLVSGDIFQALKTDRQAQLLLLLAVITLVCQDMPYISVVLYPLKMFVTIIHEACHALAARITGGEVHGIDLFVTRAGVTHVLGGFPYLVWPAGYLGTTVFGGMLMWWGRNPEGARLVLHTLGIVILALTAFYVGGGPFSFLISAFIGAGLFFIAKKASDKFCHVFLMMLSVITTLEALSDIQTLFLYAAFTNEHSDAKGMEALTGIPALFWAILWGMISISILVFSFWLSYRPQAKAASSNNKVEVPAEPIPQPTLE